MYIKYILNCVDVLLWFICILLDKVIVVLYNKKSGYYLLMGYLIIIDVWVMCVIFLMMLKYFLCKYDKVFNVILSLGDDCFYF